MGQHTLLKILASSVVVQAMLSLANFAAGLLMLRYTSAADYGMYVLIGSALLAVSGAQAALICTPLAITAPTLTKDAQAALIHTLLLKQFKIWLPLALVFGIGILLAVFLKKVAIMMALAMLAGVVSTLALLFRDYLRQIVFIKALSHWLLLIDGLFIAVQLSVIAVVVFYINLPLPWAVAALGMAGLLSAGLAYRVIGARHGWSTQDYPQALTQSWQLGRWTLTGSLITWLHTQGFYYLLAAILSVSAVAQVAAARMLLMPVNLMLGGINGQLLPIAAKWYQNEGQRSLVKKLSAITAGIVTLALVYFGFLVLFKEFIIVTVLKQSVAALQTIIASWALVFLLVIFRQMAMMVLLVQKKVAIITYLSLLSTPVSLLCAWWAISHFGPMASVWGILAGELIDLCGILAVICYQWRSLPSAESRDFAA